MTNYGPPGGGIPGPWRGQRHDETPGGPTQQPYPPAAQPYPPTAQPYPPTAQPYPPTTQSYPAAAQSYPPGARGRPGPYGDGPYGGPPVAPYGGDPSPTPGRRGRGPLIAVLTVVLLVVAAGGGALWFLGRSGDPAPSTAPTGPAAAGEPSADATAPVAPLPSAAAPESSADSRFVKVGQCVRNDGVVGGKPKLSISNCVPKSYEVLGRIDGVTTGERDAKAKCAKVENYTDWYSFDSELDDLDFVLCLKQR
ncbi:flagellar basal body protein FliL [Micromonospora sp. 067-2]|uniref:LppU/SCO3897 family protein n=1 Tax=Micromonospora sp. 067-2 TaxID=2789270 RepID=UPI00397C57CA